MFYGSICYKFILLTWKVLNVSKPLFSFLLRVLFAFKWMSVLPEFYLVIRRPRDPWRLILVLRSHGCHLIAEWVSWKKNVSGWFDTDNRKSMMLCREVDQMLMYYDPFSPFYKWLIKVLYMCLHFILQKVILKDHCNRYVFCEHNCSCGYFSHISFYRVKGYDLTEALNVL